MKLGYDKNARRSGTAGRRESPAGGNGSQAGTGKRMQGIVAYYIRYSIPEFILCLVAAFALDINTVYSFKLTETMRISYGMFIAVTAVVLALLFVFGYSSRSRLIMLPVFAAAAVVLIALCYRMGFSLIETDTREENWGVCVLVLIVVAALAYAASRTRLGCFLFLVIGAFANAWLCVCLWTFSAWALVVFLLAAGILYLYSRYRHQVLNASARGHAFLPLIGTSVIAVAVTLGLTAAVFFGVIKPLNPPVMEITLIQKVVRPEVLEVIGLSTTRTVLNDDYASDIDEDFRVTSSETNDQQQEDETLEGTDDAAPEEEAQTNEEIAAQEDESINTDSLQTAPNKMALWIILICIAAFLAACGIARYVLRHRIWLKRLQQIPDRDNRVLRMYHLFRTKFHVLGITASPYETPVQRAKAVSSKTVLMDEGGAGWVELSAIFARMTYGGISPTDEEYGQYLAYYQRFWKACRKYCRFRWLWKQFKL